MPVPVDAPATDLLEKKGCQGAQTNAGPGAILRHRGADQAADATAGPEFAVTRDPWWLYAMLLAGALLAVASMAGHVWTSP